MPRLYPIRFDSNGFSQGLDPRAPTASDRRADNVRVLHTLPADPLLLKLDASGDAVPVTEAERDQYDADQAAEREAERLEARKAALAADSAKMTAFGTFASAVDDLAAEGVTLSSMSFSGVMAALDASAFSDTKRSKWGLRLNTLWQEVVYQYDSMRAANADLPLALEILQEQA